VQLSAHAGTGSTAGAGVDAFVAGASAGGGVVPAPAPAESTSRARAGSRRARRVADGVRTRVPNCGAPAAARCGGTSARARAQQARAR